MKNTSIWITGGVVALILGALVVWFFFFRPTPLVTSVQTPQNSGFSTASNQQPGAVTTTNTETQNQVAPLVINANQKVFKIAEGPVTGATFVQTFNPTTTIARYILQENGHVLDQPLDVPGSVARAASNTTIPGTARALWANKGGVAYMQYLDGASLKTLLLIFPATATSSRSAMKPVEVKFLPDNLADLAVSPDGNQIAYLLTIQNGGEGFVANLDGSNSKKLFSFGLSQLLLSWPSPGTLLLTTKSSAASSGAAFSVNAKTGSIIPLLYAPGLTAVADRSFANIVYQAVSGEARTTYSHSIKNRTDLALSFNPLPEKCALGSSATSTFFCAAPIRYINAQYLDLWHVGAASVPESIVSFIPSLNTDSTVVAVPGSADGGVQSDILEITVSPDDKYLLFIKKGDRSLWGVRIGQN